MELLTPQEAAKLVSASYPTMKQWIYNGKVRSIKTPGGRHRIPEVDRLTRAASPRSWSSEDDA